mgnify:CR=1 FL=1
MIDGLVGGKLNGAAKEHLSKTGKRFATAKLRTPLADGDSIFVSVIAFSETVVDGLMALSDGDSVALSGALTPKVWQPASGEARPAIDLVAHALVTAYHVQRKRQQVQAKREPPSRAAGMGAMAPLPGDFPDDPL